MIKGNFLKEYNSIKEASIDIKGKQSNISCCLNGYSKTAYGFVWKFKKENLLQYL